MSFDGSVIAALLDGGQPLGRQQLQRQSERQVGLVRMKAARAQKAAEVRR